MALLLSVVALVLLISQRVDLPSIFGVKTETSDTQVIRAVERTQQISLVSLGIQGIVERDQNSKLFNFTIPGTGEKVFLQYNFTAKLGVDGSHVTIKQTGNKAFLITVPKFLFIGYDKPTFKVAAEDGGILSWFTPEIDKVEMINAILNEKAQQQYLTDNKALLESQTQTFYTSLIRSIDPAVTTTFKFSE